VTTYAYKHICPTTNPTHHWPQEIFTCKVKIGKVQGTYQEHSWNVPTP
jgi:hypothetical protein